MIEHIISKKAIWYDSLLLWSVIRAFCHVVAEQLRNFARQRFFWEYHYPKHCSIDLDDRAHSVDQVAAWLLHCTLGQFKSPQTNRHPKAIEEGLVLLKSTVVFSVSVFKKLLKMAVPHDGRTPGASVLTEVVEWSRSGVGHRNFVFEVSVLVLK